MGGEGEEIRLKVLYLSWTLEFGVVRFVFWVFRGRSPRRVFARWLAQTQNLRHTSGNDKVFADSLGSLRVGRGWVGLSQPGQACLAESGVD